MVSRRGLIIKTSPPDSAFRGVGGLVSIATGSTTAFSSLGGREAIGNEKKNVKGPRLRDYGNPDNRI
jgi:hypothetical protein